MTLFRRQRASTCFYCQSTVSHSSSSSGVFDPNFFRCPYCACWNRYDAYGQVIGDEPAMRDERLNIESFMKRGFPDRNHLPSLSSTKSGTQPSFFCHTCRTNQTLLVNLLAAYLPDPSDPTYASRKAALPAYRESLYARYPPVCATCAPAVDAEIARKDEMARTRALGGALRVSSPTLRRPGTPGGRGSKSAAKNSVTSRNLLLWRVRGILWVLTLFFVNGGYTAGLLNVQSALFQRLIPSLPVLVLLSLYWTFWDPTFSLQQRSGAQGRGVRIEGRRKFIILQGYAWLSRLGTSVLLATSCFLPEWKLPRIFCSASNPSDMWNEKRIYLLISVALEFIVLALSYLSITIRRPAPIRLIDTSAHHALASLNAEAARNPQPSSTSNGASSSVNHATVSEPAHFSTLSLSSTPVITGQSNSVNPIFGQPSLLNKSPQQPQENINDLFEPTGRLGEDVDEDEVLRRTRPRSDPDAMDWEPASPAKGGIGASGRDDGSWMRQQRFFPPEEPTGLEGLFMRTRLVDEDDPARTGMAASQRPLSASGSTTQWHWGWVYSASAVPVLALIAGLWLTGRSRV